MEAILKDTRDKLKEIEKEKLQIIKRVKKLLVADNMEPLDFKKKDKKGFIEYYQGVWIRDISSELMHVLGSTELHIMVKNDTEIPAHEHENQSQSIFIIAGKIFDYERERLYLTGECFFIPRQNNHMLKYYGNSQYLITFHPNLVEV